MIILGTMLLWLLERAGGWPLPTTSLRTPGGDARSEIWPWFEAFMAVEPVAALAGCRLDGSIGKTL